jgi:hypothetical protein
MPIAEKRDSERESGESFPQKNTHCYRAEWGMYRATARRGRAIDPCADSGLDLYR